MNLFDINEQIESLIDPETGEVADYEQFQNLNMQFGQKVENTVLYIKELRSFAKELKEQKESFEKRYKAVSNQAERLTEYVRMALGGNKFETTMCRVSPRTYPAVVIEDEGAFLEWAREHHRDDLIRVKEPEIAKSEVSEKIKLGEELPYCHIEEKQSIIIK